MKRPEHIRMGRPDRTLVSGRSCWTPKATSGHGIIGISWQDGETFLHGVQITGERDDREDNRPRPARAAPYPPCPEELEDARRQPAMSTPYQQSHEHPPSGMSTPGFPRPVCIEMSDTPTHNFAGPRQEGRPTHRPAAPIQRFNSKSIGWPAWFRHFRAVADVQGWDKDQRALQMVSYLDEKAMNVAQELSDRELYDYDARVGLLSARFDPSVTGLAVKVAISWPDTPSSGGRRHVRGFNNRAL